MANKAVPKKRAAAKAAAAANGANTGKGGKRKSAGAKAADAKAKAGIVAGKREEMAPSSVKPETIEHHAAKIFAKRRELDTHTEEGSSIRAELSDMRKKAKKDGVNLAVINDIYEMSKQDISEVRQRERDKRRYLSILKPETAKQLDMFVDSTLAVVDYDAAGYAAYKNNEPQTNNPSADAASQEYRDWNEGWMRAQVENIKTMGPTAGTAGTTGKAEAAEPETGSDDFEEDPVPTYQAARDAEATIQ